MKVIKWKSLIITCVVCLLSIVPGLVLWNDLPDTLAIHFNLNNQPDNFASKGFAVFGLPLMMVALQIICCVINDAKAYKHGERRKFATVTKWIIPVLAMVLQILTLGYGLGWSVDVRRAVALFIGIMLLFIGNYLPKFEQIKNYNADVEKAKKINRFIGFETVIMGALSIVSVFLPPISTVIWLFLLIPYAVASIVYGIKVGR